MKKIVYKTPATMLITDDSGELTAKATAGTAEIAYSAENLAHVQAVALDGKYEIVEDPDADTPELSDVWTDLDAAYREGVDSV